LPLGNLKTEESRFGRGEYVHTMTAIRLIGDHHTSHRRHTVLIIGDETAARNSPHIFTLEHARNLVAYGVAEWIGDPPAQQDHPMPQDPQSDR
jgi:hypothetical protein